MFKVTYNDNDTVRIIETKTKFNCMFIRKYIPELYKMTRNIWDNYTIRQDDSKTYVWLDENGKCLSNSLYSDQFEPFKEVMSRVFKEYMNSLDEYKLQTSSISDLKSFAEALGEAQI